MRRSRLSAADPTGPRLPSRPGVATTPPGAATSLAMTFLIVLASGGLLLVSSFVGDARARHDRLSASTPGAVLALRDGTDLDSPARTHAPRPDLEDRGPAAWSPVVRTR